MKKKIIAVLVSAFILSLCGCGSAESKTEIKENDTTSVQTGVESANTIETSQAEANNDTPMTDSASSQAIDVDLTALSSTMVYSEVYNMLVDPDSYLGKLVKVTGQYTVFTNEDESQYYNAVIIADATACCQQGFEFVLADSSLVFPDDYPETGAEITLTGEFQTYMEGDTMYCHLVNAKMS